MSSELIASVDLVIDANGLRKTGQALQTMEKYMEKLRQRAQALNRTKLTALTRNDWVVKDRAKFTLDSRLTERNKSAVKTAAKVDLIKASNMAELTTKPTNEGGQGTKSKGEKGEATGGSWWKKLWERAAETALKSSVKSLAKKPAGDLFDLVKRKFSRGTPETKEVKSSANWFMGKVTAVNAKLTGVQDRVKDKKAAAKAKISDIKDRIQERIKDKATAAKAKMSGIKGRIKDKVSTVKTKLFGAKDKVEGKASPFKAKMSNLFGRVIGKLPFGNAMMSNAKNWTKAVAKATPKVLKTTGKVSKVLGKSALKVGGKLFRPLAIAGSIASIAKAKSGKERNKAIGKAVGGGVGGAVGGALGSVLGPVGTIVGGMVGGAVGGWLGGKAGESIGKIKKLWRFGHNKDKKKKAPEAMPEPSDSRSMNETSNASSTYAQTSMGISASGSAAASSSTNVSIMSGAVQLSIDQSQKIDYEALSAQISAQLAVSIQQQVENRA